MTDVTIQPVPKDDSFSSDKLRLAGDVNVESVMVVSLATGRYFNVRNQLLTIHVFEDLFSPFTTGILVFRESLDFTNYFPLVGEEAVEFKIFTPTLNDTPQGILQGKFYIYKMEDVTEIAERSVIYKLHFISMEAITDMNSKASRPYDGVISEIAKKIMLDQDGLATVKQCNIEPTKNKTKFISNFWSPVKSLLYLTSNAVNTIGAPTFLFFENRDGFNFLSLDYLYLQPLKQNFEYSNPFQLISSTGGSSRVPELDYKRIEKLTIPVSHNFIDRVSGGMYGSRMISYDVTTMRYKNAKHSMYTDWNDPNKEIHLNKYAPQSKKLLATTRSVIFNDVNQKGVFTGYGNVSNTDITQARVSRLMMAQANKIEIVVPGRTDYTVGQVVSVKAFQKEPMNKEDPNADQIDKLTSGVYLIGAINHTISKEKHECHMELIKDSLVIDLDGKAK